MLKFQCDREELSDAFASLLGVVPSSNTTKPILLNFYITSDGASVAVAATDLHIGARVQLERVEVLEQGALVLPAQRLSALVREVPGSRVTVESLDDGRAAHVSSAGYELKILGDDPAEFPKLPDVPGEGVLGIQRELLVDSLRRVAVGASHDTSRFQLTGVCLEVGGEELVLTATDGKRLTHDSIRVENPSEVNAVAIVPNRAVDTILKILAQGEEKVSLLITETDLRVIFGRGELTTKLIQGKYPDYRWILSQQVNTKVVTNRSEMLSAVRAASLMTDKSSSTIEFEFQEGLCRLSTHAAAIGESKIELPVSAQGDPLSIRFNPNYFIDALRSVSDEEVRFEFTDSEKPGTLRGRRNYRHMIMPLVTEESQG